MLGPIEAGVNHDVLHAQNDSSCLGPIETGYSGPQVAVLQEKEEMRARTHGD